MAKPHPPSQARNIIAGLRQGEDVKHLAEEARRIADPYHAAWTLFQLSQDEPRLRRDAMKLLARVPQDWRRAELAADVSRHVKDDPDVLDALAETLTAIPPSNARSAAIQEIAKRLPPRRIPRHVKRLLRTPGAAEDAKPLLRAWAQHPDGAMDDALKDAVPAERAVLLGYLHLQGAKTGRPLVPDAFARALHAARDAEHPLEALRYLATVAQDETELAAVAAVPLDAEARVRLLARLVAAADRLGAKETAAEHLTEAQGRLPAIADEKTRGKLAANLEKAAARLQGTGPRDKEEPSRTPERANTATRLPEAGAQRPVLALHNGYTGGLAAPHVRAVARAAPLCAAFGLDLLLIGFPIDDLARLVDQVETDTNVGEGGEHARLLLAADRLTAIPSKVHANPEEWTFTGPIVATTPRPDPAKLVDLATVGPHPVVVMGLGPTGLPPQLLARAAHHLELTGHGISLETATAMGIIAERMRRHAAAP